VTYFSVDPKYCPATAGRQPGNSALNEDLTFRKAPTYLVFVVGVETISRCLIDRANCFSTYE